MRITKVLLSLAIALVAFVGGAVASFNYFFSTTAKQLESMTEVSLGERTMLLQFVRDGLTRDAEQQLESIAWNHLVTLGHQVERGERLSDKVRPAISYHCAFFEAHKSQLALKIQEERAHWCSLLQKS
jgi:hypothetical protein